MKFICNVSFSNAYYNYANIMYFILFKHHLSLYHISYIHMNLCIQLFVGDLRTSMFIDWADVELNKSASLVHGPLAVPFALYYHINHKSYKTENKVKHH